MATGWLKGTVKAVPSGDSLLIMGTSKAGPPPEKVITLASLIAPKLARRDGKDEPFAWEAREALRKKCIGKEVAFKVDYVVPSINREFGTVLMNGQNVAYDVVAEGWAKVRPQGGQANEVSATYIQELEQREAKAREEEIGIWNKTPGVAEASVRNLPPSAVGDGGNFDAMGFLEANKGTPLPAIVEQVRDGSALRVYLLPEFQYVQVYVAGIQAPSMGRRAPAGEAPPAVDTASKYANGEEKTADQADSTATTTPAPLTTAQKLAASNTAANSSEVPPDLYAREAKHFVESRVLNRDVRIVLEGVDKFNNLIGSVRYADGDVAADLALELVKQGLARVVDWSANMMEESAKRVLKTAELEAKKNKLRLWANYVPPTSGSTAIRDVNFSGKVIEIVSGDCIVVADDAAPFGTPAAERRVNLSSIRAPKVGNPKRDEKPAAYAREAKEYLRTRLIGQQVNVTMEYSRKVLPTDGPTPAPPSTVPGPDARVMDFGSVFLTAAPKGETLDTVPSSGSADTPQGINVAEMVVARGFGTVVRHREFEERSNFYDALLAAESRAQKGKKGLHSQRETPAMHINDLSLQGTTAKAKQFLPFLQRQRRLPAIVDYVLSGHRFKLLIPKETCAIAFSLSGVRCPGRGEPFADEAIAFMRRKILQREVEIEVETVDKTGTFLGSLWEGKSNVSQALLEAGLAKLHPLFTADRTTEGHLLVQSEQEAKKKQVKVWQGYVEGKAEEQKVAGDTSKSKQEVLQVKVTETLGGGKFYVQTVGDTRVVSIQNQLAALSHKDKQLPPGSFVPKKGELVIALYKEDNSWNRAMVTNAPKSGPITGETVFEVFYIDYGNEEKVPLSALRPLDVTVSAAPQGVAQLCKLAHIKVPELDQDFGVDAAHWLGENIGNSTFVARVVEKDTSGGKVKGQGTGPCLSLMLEDAEGQTTVNARILEAGLGRVEKAGRWDSAEKKAALEALLEFQEIARKGRRNMWMYGDVESDEEDTPSRGRGGGRGR